MNDEQIIEMAKQLGFERMRIDHDYYVCFSKEIVEFAKLVAQREREACAKIVELNADACRSDNVAQMILYSNAVAIRARGQRTPEGGEA